MLVQVFFVLQAILGEEVADQRGDIFLALAQRRQHDVDHVQPVVQVLAEGALVHALLQVVVGGRQDAHVHAHRFGGAQGDEFLLLDDAQQLGLHVRRNGADLVEEDGAMVGHFEIALLGVDGAGKGALHMAEQRGFQQVGGQRAAIYGHEHALRAWRIGVDGFGDQLLARAGFAGDQDGGAAGGDLPHQVEQAQHAVAFADDVGEAVALLQGALEVGVLVFQAPLGDHAVDLDQQLLIVPGLGEVIVGAQLQRIDGGFHRAVGGDHEDGGFAVAPADIAQHIHAGTVGHHEIEQHHVVGARFDLAQAFGAVRGEIHTVAFQAEERFQAFADVHLVIHYQHVAFAGGGGEFGC